MRKSAPSLLACLVGLAAAASVGAQSLTVYDDALQNGFQDYSYNGGTNFAATAFVHGGTKSISFVGGTNFNAIGMFHNGGTFTTSQYPTLHFFVNGGAGNGQQLRVELYNGPNNIVWQQNIDQFISGGSIAAGTWRDVTIPLGVAAPAYSGAFDRIDFQTDVGTAQPALYIDDVTLVPGGGGPPANGLVIDHDVTLLSMVSDRFTWQDAGGQPRVAVLAHNDGQIGPTSPSGYTNHGGALREYRYQVGATTRIAGPTNYGNGGYGGFGYVVSHRGDGTTGIGGADDSPLGYAFTGGFERVFEGRHHAIFRFTQLYPRYSSTSANPANHLYNVPVTIDWIFSTGRDHPVWAVTWDLSGVPADALNDDSRGPYGELEIDGDGSHDVDGVAWGDRWKFTSTTAPVTLDSSWTWNVQNGTAAVAYANAVPYVKLWIVSTDATMGMVSTQTMTQQDAGAGRNPIYHDLTPYWGHTSADGNAGGANKMPWQDSWPYQANSFSIGPAPNSNNNARLTWGTEYGFLGQTSYAPHDGVVASAPGWPKKSYSQFVILGKHSSLPVEAQMTQVQNVQSLSLTASTGTVVTSGPAGVNRVDTVTYAPAGYDHVYGALAFRAAANQLDANVAVGSGTLQKPLVIVSNYTAGAPTVTLGGSALTADVDYFASLRPGASELWITLNRNLSGATNHLQITSLAPPPGGFYSLTPCRLVDTRNAAGPYGGPALVNGTRNFALAGQCGIPSNATAVAVNVAVTAAGAGGFLTLFPQGASLPNFSSINYAAGQTRANNAIVPLSGTGGMSVACSQASGSVQFILDVFGYFQ